MEKMKQKRRNDFRARARNNIHFNINLIYTFIKACVNIVIEYCDNSNIHGVRYFSERRLHWSERCWWFSFVGTSTVLCVIFLGFSWDQWNDTPVLITLSEKENQISYIPFPTITLCPETKSSKQNFDVTQMVDDMLDGKLNLSKFDLANMEAMSHVCTMMPDLFHFDKRTDLNDYLNESMYGIIQELAPTNDTIDKCWWESKITDCWGLFKPVLTEEGVCYTYNSLNSHDIYTEHMAPGMMTVNTSPNLTNWHLEKGYWFGPNTKPTFPIRVVDSGRGAALDIVVSVDEQEFEYQCRGFDQGFKVAVTLPGEALKLQRTSYRVPISEDTLITIKPHMMITSPGLRHYDPLLIHCVFSEDRPLRFYKLYTQTNCYDECLANFTKLECGCVHFSMPRERDTKICGGAKIKCIKEAQRNIYETKRGRDFKSVCDCYPLCTTLDYYVSVDRVRFDMAAMNSSETPEYSKQQARLAVFFRDQHVETLKRLETYTWSDFMAMCGGLLGLFLGISILSVIEFVYYASLRKYWFKRREREDNARQQLENQKIVSVIPMESYKLGTYN